MKRLFPSKATCVIIIIGAFMLCESVCIGQSESSGGVQDIPIPPDASAEKVKEWQGRRNVMDNEYDVCLEHCASDKSCEDRCESVYKSRMAREFRAVFGNQ